MFEFCMTFAANINIIPEFCIAFARKMSKFYMIIARKICPKNIFLNILQIFFRYGGEGALPYSPDRLLHLRQNVQPLSKHKH